MPQANRKPNWKVWAHVPAVRVWEAVALSFDIDPKKVKVRSHAWMGNGSRYPHDEGQQFEDRIEVLRRNLGQDKGLRPASIVMGRRDYCEIALSDFAQWAMLLGWDIPSEIKALAARAPTPDERTPLMKTRNQSAKEEGTLVLPQPLTLAWLWNHAPVTWWATLATAFVAVFGLGISVGQSEFYRRITTSAKPVTSVSELGKSDLVLGSSSADRFVNYIRVVPEPREQIRMGCAAADERACVLAGQFVELFRRAGWTVLGDKVERVQLGKPARAIVLFKRGVGAQPVPKDSGAWVHQTISWQVLQGALTVIGLAPETAVDSNLPEGVIGVYVGPL